MSQRFNTTMVVFVFLFAISQLNLRAESRTGKSREFQKTNQNKLCFTENKGQVSDQFNQAQPDLLFYAESKGLNYHFKKQGVSYQLTKVESWKEEIDISDEKLQTVGREPRLIPDAINTHRIDISWLGANESINTEKGLALPGYNNYYLAVCPDGVTNVKSYESITYKSVYDGVDIKYYENKGDLEYDFILSPGADPSKIKWQIDGADNLSISDKGELVIKTALGEIIEQAPIAWQGQTEVKVNFVLEEDNQVSFEVGPYNYLAGLVIDPIVAKRLWGTYYGGNSVDYGIDVEITGNNNIYMTGVTFSSTGIATVGAFDFLFSGGSYPSGGDAYLVKFDSTGTRQWATYIGGTDKDWSNDCTVDNSENIYIVGSTLSSSSISTIGGHQTTYGGNEDAFVSKFNSSGFMQWSTYYGGSNIDVGYDIELDNGQNVIVVGYTLSSSGISTSGSFQPIKSGVRDAFIVRMDPNGVRLYGSYFGGNNNDYGTSLEIDEIGNYYISGHTISTAGISTSGVHQVSLSNPSSSNTDAFLARFSNTNTLSWSTYFGGPSGESNIECAVSSSSLIYITGTTTSSSNISSAGSFKETYDGQDGFIGQLDSTGNLNWATYYGGLFSETLIGCHSTQSGIYVTGFTFSDSLATPLAHQTIRKNSAEAYLANFDHSGKLIWTTYYGGQIGTESGWGITSNSDYIIFSGYTNSVGNGIANDSAHQTTRAGGDDAFLVMFYECNPDSVSVNLSVCGSFTSPSGNHIWSSSGQYTDTLQNSNGCDSIIFVDLIVTPLPIITTLGSFSRCGNGSIQINASADTGMIFWYANAIGGLPLDSGNNYNTPILSNSATFHASASLNGCFDTARTSVSAVILSIPSVLSSAAGDVCDSGTANLNAIASAGNLNWYATLTGGPSLFTGSNFITPFLTLSTTYYAEAIDSGCVSPRDPVIASVLPAPTLTINSAGHVCDSGSVAISASTTGGKVYWYSSSPPTIPIDSGVVFNTPGITSTTGYVAAAIDNGCISTAQTIPATVFYTPQLTYTLPIPEFPVLCDSGTATLNILSSGGTVSWYTQASGGSPVGSGLSFNTPNLNATTNYYAEGVDSTCVSNRLPFSVFVYSTQYTAINPVACKYYTSPGGQFLTQTGTYTDNLQTSNLCDSILTINLTINSADTSVVNTSRDLSSNAISATYQWLDCSDNSIINGETNQTFIPNANGSYAVIVTENGCTDTSACYNITTVGIAESNSADFKLFPNPTSSEMTLELDKEYGDVQIRIEDANGRLIQNQQFKNESQLKMSLNGSNGLYIIHVTADDKQAIYRVIKE